MFACWHFGDIKGTPTKVRCLGAKRTSCLVMAVSQTVSPLRPGSVCVVPRGTTQMYMEKVRSQFLSLRHLGQSHIFSASVSGQFKPNNDSDFSFARRTPSRQGVPHCSPKGAFISEALYSAASVRFSKLQRFEEPTNFNEKDFAALLRQARASEANSQCRGLNPSALGQRPTSP
jgi:hypothetical protein